MLANTIVPLLFNRGHVNREGMPTDIRNLINV